MENIHSAEPFEFKAGEGIGVFLIRGFTVSAAKSDDIIAKTSAADIKNTMDFHKEFCMLQFQNSKHILTVEPDREYLFMQILKFAKSSIKQVNYFSISRPIF